jgi:hypothetical protein
MACGTERSSEKGRSSRFVKNFGGIIVEYDKNFLEKTNFSKKQALSFVLGCDM